jgi:hypothetical protein
MYSRFKCMLFLFMGKLETESLQKQPIHSESLIESNTITTEGELQHVKEHIRLVQNVH